MTVSVGVVKSSNKVDARIIKLLVDYTIYTFKLPYSLSTEKHIYFNQSSLKYIQMTTYRQPEYERVIKEIRDQVLIFIDTGSSGISMFYFVNLSISDSNICFSN